MMIVSRILIALLLFGSPQSDAEIYARFRAWVTQQPAETRQSDVEGAYRRKLQADGVGAAEIDRQLRIITEQGQKLEIDLWNRFLTSPTSAFNTKPNAFLVEMTKSVAPGK